MFGVVALGRTLDKFEEVAQVFAFSDFEFGKLDAHSEGWTAFRDDSGEDESFDPDLSVGQPETDLHAYARWDGASSLDEATPDAGIGQISPDGNSGVTQTQLDRDEAP